MNLSQQKLKRVTMAYFDGFVVIIENTYMYIRLSLQVLVTGNHQRHACSN